MTTALQRGSAAIVGVAESDLGAVAAGMTAVDLMAQGVIRALDDCGLALPDVDGVFAAATQSRMASMALCEYLGIAPRYHDTTYMGGSSFMTLVAHAQAAIEAGLCTVAVIAYGSARAGATTSRRGTSTRTRRPSSLFCPQPPTRWRRPATCTSTARRANNSRTSPWRRASGRCAIRRLGKNRR